MGKKGCCTPGALTSPVSNPSQDGGQYAGGDNGYRSPLPPAITALERVATGATEAMIELPGGVFRMGTDRDEQGFPEDGEGPARSVELQPFWIDRSPVTNRQFAAFIKDTGYVTEAERFGWSFVFHNQMVGSLRQNIGPHVPGLNWWFRVDGACWSKPEGPGSKLKGRMDHPVVHVAWHDAAAYAAWAGKRLPTEAEWEYACRGGHEGRIYPWGDELEPGGKHLMNVWQGDFPRQDDAKDGWSGTCPVDTYPANDFGLVSMTGNAWEWVADWWSATWHAGRDANNPIGPDNSSHKVMRGGSFLCHLSYCNRYRCAARTANTPDSASCHLTFRCVRDVAPT